ncbi:hypothetical protein BJ165DRAFT_1134254 [Panaeolus papilionaceus]|nr:hypothetical protein BJ165DRAFT_1134254 [Panaeolus papilionaceus]
MRVVYSVSPLPVIRNAAENERIAADSRMDRMTIWMKNVEKVVEDAKQNFAASTSPVDLPLPPLPVPLARNHSQSKPSRLPRRVLAASQIFQSDENGNISPMFDNSMMSAGNLSAYQTANTTSNGSTGPAAVGLTSPARRASTSSAVRDDSANQSQLVIPEIHTPSRQRRATVSTSSPGPESPSKKKEKSRSHGNLFQRHIAPIAVLEAELAKPPPPVTTPRLSQVLDRSLFIAPQLTSRDNLLEADSFERGRETSFDELTSSPLQVEPYPQRTRASYDHAIPDTPSRHRIEGVYDRFLMATSGVKRVGKGYQSENVAPAASRSSSQAQGKHRAFYTTRKPMPPPVSSDDLLKTRAASVDELGMMHYGVVDIASPSQKEDGHGTVAFMKKAIKLMVPKNNTSSKRLSRMG